MNPATFLIKKLKLDEYQPSNNNWRYIKCVLEIISENDARPFRNTEYTDPVSDVEDRIREAGVEDNAQAFLLLRQHLAQVRYELR